MTTTQPAALPELPEGVTLEDLLIPLRAALGTCHDTDWTLRQFKTHITHALAALAALQSQPAEVSDEIVNAVVAQAIFFKEGVQTVKQLRSEIRAILALRPQSDHPDTARCIKARNDLNAALHGDGALIDDLEHAVANACTKLKRCRYFADERAAFESWMSEGGKWPKAVERSHNGDYLLLQTATNWATWQACASLRPQAVPMTYDLANEFAREMVKGGRSVEWLVRKVEAHHGITAPAGGEKQA